MRFLVALLSLSLLATLPADAQHRRRASEIDRDRDRERDREMERQREREREACKEPVKAAGDARYLVSAARKSAIKRWQEQVINAHGERFISFDIAKVVDFHCDPARIGGSNNLWDLKRCVIVARPCRNEG
jgi:hypothetical protein